MRNACSGEARARRRMVSGIFFAEGSQHDFTKLLHVRGSERLFGFAAVARRVFKIGCCRYRRGNHVLTIAFTGGRKAFQRMIFLGKR